MTLESPSPSSIPGVSPASVLFSLDVEDRQQLLERKAGHLYWNRPTASFRRQMTTALDVLDELGCRATHFMLGVTAENHPDLVQRAAARGDEIACHGYSHRRVYRQSRVEFERELVTATETLESITGERPRGFRAPWFSVNKDCTWMYEVLHGLGYVYDASLNDTPRVPRRLKSMPHGPFTLRLSEEKSIDVFPVTCLRVSDRWAVPAGGGGYWRVLPIPWVQRAVMRSIATTGVAPVYSHPYEFDPVRLATIRRDVPGLHLGAQARAVWDNFRRANVLKTLRAVSKTFPLTTYMDGRNRMTGLPRYALTPRGHFRLIGRE